MATADGAKLISSPLSIFVLVFISCNAVCVLAFACSFYAFQAECYVLPSEDDFSFAQMLWLSIHTFTTVG